MAKPGKPLGVAVSQDNCKCNGRKVKAKWIDPIRRDDKSHGHEDHHSQGGVGMDDPGWNFTDGGSLISGIDASVYIAIEGHGGTAGEDHAHQDEDKKGPLNPTIP